MRLLELAAETSRLCAGHGTETTARSGANPFDAPQG
jgi:hypothetical protein